MLQVDWSTYSADSANLIKPKEVIDSVSFFAGGVDVVYRNKNNTFLSSNPPRQSPDEIRRERYLVKDGKLVHYSTKRGRHIPAQWVPERIEFD